MDENLEKTDRTQADSALAEKLYADSKKRTGYARAAALCAAGILLVMIASAAILVPKVLDVLQTAEEAVAGVQTAADDIAVMADNISVTSEKLDAFIDQNADAMTELVERVGSIDYETLNEAIKDLKDAVEPFANLMNKFR